MESEYIVDRNTLYIRSEGITFDSLKTYLTTLFKDIAGLVGNVPQTFKINIPKNATTFAYVWVDSPEIVNVLVGLNPDGTSREIVNIIPADEGDDDDWFAEPVASKTVTKLPPLIDIPLFQGRSIEIGRLWVDPNTPGKQRNSLVTFKPPECITTDFLQKHFSRFAVHGGLRVTKTNNAIFVNFNPSSNDALFAKEMNMFTTVACNGRQYLLKFNHPDEKRR